ncbi:tetratricopeptide repeat protein [Flavihumibacter stibioxidans]|uniref:Tetratricopeptide repeat protein n=1 Tax=Flavihumibacter stibioxidans TaxID=1834163 RepID=A0ABR7MDC6_9BACT|nr:hypothetical protein [Flavihumibacter stibioxidans]MBC6493032.1 hypothetical protein [Flavihumibacter stibioxidans]
MRSIRNIFYSWILFLLCQSPIQAQDCDPAIVANHPGKWKQGMQGSSRGVSPASLSRQREIIQAIIRQMQSNHQLRGFNISYSGVHGYPNPDLVKGRKTDSYEAGMAILPIYCSDGVLKEAHETPFWLRIGFNNMPVTTNASFFVRTNEEEEDPETDVLGAIDSKPVNDRSVWLLKRNFTGGFGVGLTEYKWIISYRDELPFTYLTKKELCAKLKDYHQKKLKYVKFEYEKKSHKEKLERIEEFVHNATERVLNEPATSHAEILQLFASNGDVIAGFPETTDPNARWVVKNRENYFNASLPLHTPQLITLTFSVNEKNEQQMNTMFQLVEAIDINNLKTLLGNPNAFTKGNPSKPANTKPTPPNTNSNIIITTASASGAKRQVTPYDIYKNVPDKKFMPTPLAQITNVVRLPTIPPAIRAAAMQITMTNNNRQEILKKLLFDIRQQLKAEQLSATEKILSGVNSKPIDLADLGVMLFYKGNTTEGLWCLAQAAAFDPQSDYILNNLAGVLTTSGAAPRALPILRYLQMKHPKNTTVLNNLGQAWFQLGELTRSKTALDSCLRYMGHHPQANYTRAAIAEKEGKNQEAVALIHKSLKGAYNKETEELAGKKRIKIDWGNYLNLRRPVEVAYINPLQLRPPAQCTNVASAGELESQWKAWEAATEKMTAGIEAGMEEAALNAEQYAQEMEKKNGIAGAVTPYRGIMSGKASKLYTKFLKQFSELSAEANQYLSTRYKKEEEALEQQLEKAYESITEKYAKLEGEGKGLQTEARCQEWNSASNTYLQQMAALHDDFNNRFSEPMRSLAIEMMFWSQYLPEPVALREGKYYEMALKAVQPIYLPSKFIYPCGEGPRNKAITKDTLAFQPYCPISFKFKIKVVKVTGDCSKLEFEIEAAGLVLGMEKDFVNKKSTLAFGVGASLDFDRDDLIGEAIPQFIDLTGSGVGGKFQGFIEFNRDGTIADAGVRGEASLEGPLTDRGDIKVNGKLGVNSGVDVTGSDAANGIADSINGLITTGK